MSTEYMDVIWIVLLAADLVLAGSSRLFHCIRIVALQGILLGVLMLLSHGLSAETFAWQTVLTALIQGGIKGGLLPFLLIRAVRRADIRRELEPFIGYSLSLTVILLMAAAALVFCRGDWLAGRTHSFIAVPAALTTMMTGLLLIVARRKAITQAMGFLVFENGITAFGIGMNLESGFAVEMGILLDVLVLVFIMGITLFHINREFEHLDADKLNELGDLVENQPAPETNRETAI
ncbi:MAG: hydrogenase [Lentisphaeria bacterium]|nr:hydrogenase [Lentisphaeria bacterium]